MPETVTGQIDRKEIELLMHKHNFKDFTWIDPAEIVVAQWVRIKCMFGCRGYDRLTDP